MTTETTPATTDGQDAPNLIEQLAAAPLSRRQFIGASAGALVVAFGLEGTAAAASFPPTGADPSGAQLGGYVMVGADGTVTILFGGAEMGQGGATGIAQIVAEELGAKWSDVTVQSAPVGGAWATGPVWLTGGSSTIRSNMGAMQTAGAQAREMLVAAALTLPAFTGKAAADLQVADSVVSVKGSPTTAATFATLAPVAAGLPVPAASSVVVGAMPRVYVNNPDIRRLDIPAKTDGSAIFGIDVTSKLDPRLAVRTPTANDATGMLFAVVRNAPVYGGTLKSTPAIPAGASAVVNLGDACAVVASNTWAAIMAAKQLQASWTTPADAASRTSSTILSTAQTALASGTGIVAEGDPAAANAAIGSPAPFEATYTVPYLAHFPMEVPNATVLPLYAGTTLTGLEIWIPTQAASWVQTTAINVARAVTGVTLAASAVKVHTTLLGGGFGRKIEQDYAVHAVKTALGLRKPVKVTWPREEDVSHDWYRPLAVSRVRAKQNANGSIAAWSFRGVSQSILKRFGWWDASWGIGPDGTAVECATTDTGVPYATGTRGVEWVPLQVATPTGFWRSVGASINTFVIESAIDELAARAGYTDEAAYRRMLLAAADAGDTRALRFRNVLDAVVSLSSWGSAPPAGRARGISISTCFDSVVGEVVEVSKVVNSSTGAVSMKVHNVWVVLDCGGFVVNPNAVQAQLQGGVVYGLSAALWHQITWTSGKTDQQNISKYRMLRGSEMPFVTTQVIDPPTGSAYPTGGVGEVAVPGIAPAIASAWSKLNGGTRYRTLPIFPGTSMGG